MPTVIQSIISTAAIYLPAWAAGVIIALTLSAIAWFAGRGMARVLYIVVAGMSFVPVTVLMPYFLRGFGLQYFAYPLLALPVALVMYASFHEAFGHSNKARASLMTNYGMSKVAFFFRVLLRESIPSIHTSLRFTLSMAFAIFLALDYFMETWGGLGALVRYHYNRLAFDYPLHNGLMGCTVLSAGILGSLQVLVLAAIAKPFTEFRKHY